MSSNDNQITSRTVTVWVTPDGVEHESEAAAQRHAVQEPIEAFVQDMDARGGTGAQAFGSEFATWVMWGEAGHLEQLVWLLQKALKFRLNEPDA